MKKHFYEIDFIRIICAIGIIVFHYSCHTSSTLKLYYEYVNGTFGNLTVIVFFIISGFCLYLSNREIKSLKNFYIKRLKTLLPMFYICWFIFYVINVIKVRYPFYAGSPLKFIFTLLDIDGLVQERIVNYYTVGEWFSGALLITYLLYPLMLKGLNKNDKLTLLALVILNIVWNVFNIPTITLTGLSIVECCLEVYIGMYLCKHWDNFDNKKIFIISLVYFLLCLFIEVTILNKAIVILHGISYFIVLFNIGKLVTNSDKGKNICLKLGQLTYPMFLLQHQIINYVLVLFDPISPMLVIVNICLCIAIIIAISKVLTIVIGFLNNGEWFKKLGNQ